MDDFEIGVDENWEQRMTEVIGLVNIRNNTKKVQGG